MDNKYKNVFNKIKTILNMDVDKDETVEVETKLEEVVEVVETEVKLAEATLEGGDKIYFDGTLGVDTAVFTDEALEVPVADGDFVLENGDAFVVKNGVVTTLTPAEVEEEPEEEALEVNDFELKYNDLLEVVTGLKKQLEKFNKQEKDMKLEIEKLSTEPEVESISQKPMDVRPLTDVEKRLETLEAIRKLQG